MAAHSLSIAKASLLASCLRPDNTKLSRDDLTTFHNLLETSIASCTPSNIQTSEAWLLQHILPSSARTSALAKYLVSLAKNVSTLPESASTVRTCRKQLHILYLVNDIFHHVKHHIRDEEIRKNVHDHIPKALPELFASTAQEKKSRTLRRLSELMKIWESERYCDSKTISSLKEVIETGTLQSSNQTTKEEVKTSSKELPWIMPATHGDPSAPFFDLPAANLMPHIVPNSSRSMRSDDIRALQLNAGPADESLVNALKDFLKDVQSIDDPYTALEDEGIVPDIDEMGQISYKNEADDVVGDTYYGWSRAFCDKMKTRDKEESGPQRGRSRSVSSDSSSSTSPRKRRRYSSSRSRSRSSSRDRSAPRQGMGFRRSSPRAQASRSFSPQQHQQHPQRFGNGHHDNPHAPPPAPPPAPIAASLPNTTPPNFRRTSSGINEMSVPPPRPPNWQGPWPPPPPPPPPASGSFSNIPYPPPSHQAFNQYGYGQR